MADGDQPQADRPGSGLMIKHKLCNNNNNYCRIEIKIVNMENTTTADNGRMRRVGMRGCTGEIHQCSTANSDLDNSQGMKRNRNLVEVHHVLKIEDTNQNCDSHCGFG